MQPFGTSCRATVLPLLILPAVLYSGLVNVRAADSEPARLVVVLYPEANDGSPGSALADRGIRAALTENLRGRVELHSEHLDVSRFPDPAYQQELSQFLHRKYAHRKVDLVIAGLASAVDFAIDHRSEAFPGAPLVAFSVDQKELNARTLAPDVIGVPIKMELRATLDLALKFHPQTRNVYVIVGRSKFDAHWEAEARQAFPASDKKLTVTYLVGLSMPDLLRQVANLPDQSVIYYLHVFEDGDGVVHSPAEVLSQIAAVAKFPIYSHVESYVGRGSVGGRVFSFEEEGKRAGQVAVRLLNGEPATTIGQQIASQNAHVFDWRQLRRWGIDESSLPPDSIVRFKEPTVWDLYKWQILGLVVVCLTQAALIVGLIVQRVRRRRAESELHESQNKLQELTGKLLVAQELERRRIACELHDDFGQELALLSVEIDVHNQNDAAPRSEREARVVAISTRVKQLSSSIHDLSHRLHPMKLEQLGLSAAVRSLCSELSPRNGLNIKFIDRKLPAVIAPDVALCLYRIVQEALRNVVKHSAAHTCEVEISCAAQTISLLVRDDGVGFDPKAVDGRLGLGLISMRERLRVVQGEIVITARPDGGTEIAVRIPLKN